MMQIPLVDLRAQYASIKEEIDAAIHAVVSDTAFIGGAHLKNFEHEFAEFCGVKHCVGVGNGTDALFIALKVLGVGKGDEVITAANSFVATSEAITMAGARVAFVDINAATYNIDVEKIEERISERTKAIIPVHLFGQPADMAAILELSRKYNLRIVADAAQAHGSLYRGQPIARLADLACFSFYPGKNLGAYGDGGALLTDNQEWADKARMFANHGRVQKYEHQVEGVNSRLDGLQAAILSVKLRHLDEWTRCRRRNAGLYSQYLKALGVSGPVAIEDVRAAYHLYVIRVEAEIRSKLQEFLNANGVSTGVHYPIALPYLESYNYLNHEAADFREALRASKEILSLPMYPELTDEQIQYVVEKIAEFLQTAGNRAS